MMTPKLQAALQYILLSATAARLIVASWLVLVVAGEPTALTPTVRWFADTP